MLRTIIYVCFILFLWSCQRETAVEQEATPVIQEIATPCKEGGEGRLFTSTNGEVYLSWVEFLNDSTDALRFARLENGQWGAPQEIAQGSDWFVNWADFPSLVTYPENDQMMVAHWLQMRAEGTYDYDVHLSLSQDGGQTWSPSFIPHRDSIAAEHGFVSMLPMSEQQVFVTWLDGRNTKDEGYEAPSDDHGHGHGGAMTLRAAIVDPTGTLSQEVELDARVCDCCHTSAALTSNGPIVAYRDRSEEEIRDIYIVRQVAGQWQAPTAVHQDNWGIAGCPVNGPVIKAKGDNVAVAWFTAPEGKSEVRMAFSTDQGASFSAPVRLDHGLPLGRVGLAFTEDDQLIVTWLEQTEEAAEIRLACVNLQGEKEEELVLAEVEASRQSGFPVITMHEDKVYFAYTQVDSLTRVVSGVVEWEREEEK
ncbi:MAG: sialidase family protein [Lewinella sp.]|uniref:sialidase family protein n=1 Tax=Lewinella sp. TaxID=2004506 RepID=UPI003D6BBD2E